MDQVDPSLIFLFPKTVDNVELDHSFDVRIEVLSVRIAPVLSVWSVFGSPGINLQDKFDIEQEVETPAFFNQGVSKDI